MADELSDELNRMYQEQIIRSERREQVLAQTDAVLNKAQHLLDPRRQFENWSRSQSGQAWKAQQFKQQLGRCARCNKPFVSVQSAEIHHVCSLHHAGRHGNTVQNYLLLCTLCNRQVGTMYDGNLSREER